MSIAGKVRKASMEVRRHVYGHEVPLKVATSRMSNILDGSIYVGRTFTAI